MPTPSATAKALAESLRAQLAQPNELTRAHARLYSNAVRCSWGVPGLASWSHKEATGQLNDAMRLVEAARIQSAAGDFQAARDCYKRAAEVIEWLVRSASVGANANGMPVPPHIVAAACYQLADCPAMASIMIAQAPQGSVLTELIGAFLGARFDEVIRCAATFWSSHIAFTGVEGSFAHLHATAEADVSDPVLTLELVRCLGTFSHAMAIDQEDRIALCVRKLRGLSRYAAHAAPSFVWMLLTLLADTAVVCQHASVHRGVDGLIDGLTVPGQAAARMFATDLFARGRGLLWPTQRMSLAGLALQRSAAICTPTGSGKTTIAEFALIQALHPAEDGRGDSDAPAVPPLAVYLVPSRALAAEVEARLTEDLGNLPPGVLITGLYGGTEWSIADAWLTAEKPTILIATAEKTDALLRFIGPLVFARLRLLVLDEAHQIDLGNDHSAVERVLEGESRQGRLESLVARVLSGAPQAHCLALSAVAGPSRRALARWVSGGRDDNPLGSEQRSTRQVVGMLQCGVAIAPVIKVEAVDGVRLTLQGREEAPYIPLAIPAMPRPLAKYRDSLEAYRLLQCLWTAVHLAQSDRTVLISVMQRIDVAAHRCVDMLRKDGHWSTNVPAYFKRQSADAGGELFGACLQACRDYCGNESFEAVLLEAGVALHHGQLPVRVRRLMTEVIRAKLTPIALATSTLTEGVNLPFDVILIPSIMRSSSTESGGREAVTVSAAEFRNLAGRAGRPGSTIEGMTLIAEMSEPSATGTITRRKQRLRVVQDAERARRLIVDASGAAESPNMARSALVTLLQRIELLFRRLQPSASAAEFETWLERCAPLAAENQPTEAAQCVDVLDQHVLGLLVAAEERLPPDAAWSDVEQQLQVAWAHTYARYATDDPGKLERLVNLRGRGLRDSIYPSSATRRQLYRIGLPPQRGLALIQYAPELEAQLARGGEFAAWSVEQRCQYVLGAAEIVNSHSPFRRSSVGESDWRAVLRWWLAAPFLHWPEPAELRQWQRIVAECFEFQLCSTITATIGLALDRISGGELVVPAIEDWPAQTGLPWAAFWIRELIAWGTLEPVAAYLMSSSSRLSRTNAEAESREFYDAHPETDVDDRIDPRVIRDWTRGSAPTAPAESVREIPVRLLRNFPDGAQVRYAVIPVVRNGSVIWLDVAGYALAESDSQAWRQKSGILDFSLDVSRSLVMGS